MMLFIQWSLTRPSRSACASRSLMRIQFSRRLARLLAEPHEGEAALEPLSVEVEFEHAALEILAGIAARLPAAAVPQHDRGAAVLAPRVAPSKSVLDGMVLGTHREALVGGIEARAARHRPALHDAVELEAKIVVETAGVVHLHHEAPS